VTAPRRTTPTPNCGHGGATFTHVSLAGVWLCPLCMKSIGALYARCTRCGRFPAPGAQLVPCFGGHLCPGCRRDLRAQRPGL
jgi:hypothetical protein